MPVVSVGSAVGIAWHELTPAHPTLGKLLFEIGSLLFNSVDSRSSTMAKKKDKKKNKGDGAVSMDIPTRKEDDVVQAMDTTEGAASEAVHGVLNKKIKKGVQMKRSKSARKMKAIKKAISKSEKLEERSKKSGMKVSRIQSAKLLYD